MSNDRYGLYRYWLGRNRSQQGAEDADRVIRTINDDLKNTAAFQPNAQRNGVTQGMIVTRTDTNICKVTLLPNDVLFIGDLVSVFGEEWLCMELRKDEYNVTYAELWMCNHTFVYQDFAGKIIRKSAIIDDGSYSKGSDKPIPVIDGTHRCYVSLDEESRVLYVDKRLAMDTMLDKNGSTILNVGKIRWLDTKIRNYGNGSHLLTFSMADDVFNKEADNIELMICNYFDTQQAVEPSQEIVEQEQEQEVVQEEQQGEINAEENTVTGYLVIEGKDSIRIGTSRTYKVTAKGADGSSQGLPEGVEITVQCDNSIVATQNGGECRITVPLKDSLIGSNILISCRDTSGVLTSGNKTVAVISIG